MTITIKLPKAVIVDGKTYETAEFGEPSLGGLEAFEDKMEETKRSTKATIALLVVDLGWPIEAVRMITMSDLIKVTDTLAPFNKATAEVGGAPGEAWPPTSATS